MAPNLKWIMVHQAIDQNNQISQKHSIYPINMRMDHIPSLFSFYLKSLTWKRRVGGEVGVGEVEHGPPSFYFQSILEAKRTKPSLRTFIKQLKGIIKKPNLNPIIMIHQSLLSTTQLIKYITLWYHQITATKNLAYALLFLCSSSEIPEKKKKIKKHFITFGTALGHCHFWVMGGQIFPLEKGLSYILRHCRKNKKSKTLQGMIWVEVKLKCLLGIYKHLRWVNERKWFWELEAQMVSLVEESLMVFQNSSVSQRLLFSSLFLWFLLQLVYYLGISSQNVPGLWRNSVYTPPLIFIC